MTEVTEGGGIVDKLDFVDNSDEIARKFHRHYRIQGLAEDLLPIFMKTNLDEEDIRDAVEQVVQELFSKS